MSAVALDVTTSRPSSTRLHAVSSEAPAEKASAAAAQPDIAVVSTALAVLTILRRRRRLEAGRGRLRDRLSGGLRGDRIPAAAPRRRLKPLTVLGVPQ